MGTLRLLLARWPQRELCVDPADEIFRQLTSTPAPTGAAAGERVDYEAQQEPVSYSLSSFKLREDRQSLVGSLHPGGRSVGATFQPHPWSTLPSVVGYSDTHLGSSVMCSQTLPVASPLWEFLVSGACDL